MTIDLARFNNSISYNDYFANVHNNDFLINTKNDLAVGNFYLVFYGTFRKSMILIDFRYE